MIERYSLTSSMDQLRERFSVDVPEFYKPCYNASPTHLLPVITNHSSSGVSLFYWGETPGWAKNKTPGEKIINARVEHVSEKMALKKAMMKSRCIIPADGFYAWKKIGKKTSIPYRFVLVNKELFSIAGLWEEFEDENESVHTFTIFTLASNEIVSAVQDRMPVILDPEAEKIWLDPNASDVELLNLLVACPANKKLSYYSVSPRINDIKIDLESLITPMPPADQFGNLTLFD